MDAAPAEETSSMDRPELEQVLRQIAEEARRFREEEERRVRINERRTAS